MKHRLLFATTLAVLSVPALAQPAPMEVFDRADADRDGAITLLEFKASRARQFSRFDRNGDGYVSQADVGRIAQFRPEVGQRLAMLIQTADANRDRRVSRVEFNDAPTLAFERADTDHNGAVDKAELERLRQER